MSLTRGAFKGSLGIALLVTCMFTSVLAVGTVEPDSRALDEAKLVRGWRFTRMEGCFMHKVNAARRRHGRATLNRDPQLGYVGRIHSNRMASYSSIWHDNVASKVTRWIRVGQNVGAGKRCRGLFRAFMRSYTHRRNILGRWRHQGVGIDWRNGRLYVHMIFESRRDPGNIWHYP